MRQVSVLFTRKNSVYRDLVGTDCWDLQRDARLWPGGTPVIAHPPCRSWGKLAHFAKPRPGERELAFYAVRQVNRYGGVLEHPLGSRLWKEAGLPPPLLVNQCDFGHRALKPTWLHIVGAEIPPLPPKRKPTTTVENMGRAERESTPPEFASWLLELARSVKA